MKAVRRAIKDKMNRPGFLRKVCRIAVLIAVLLPVILSAAYFAALPRNEHKPPPEFPVHMENGAQALTVDSFGAVSVTDSAGTVWHSNVTAEQALADETASGVYKLTMQSQMVIRYCDADNRIQTSTSYGGALNSGKKAPVIQNSGDLYAVTYEFMTGKSTDNLFISVTVEYSLAGGMLQARVPFEKIKENEKFKLLDISLLPHFGAGAPDAEGYILVPDGNGALIDFNSPQSGAEEYSGYVYGRDATLRKQAKDVPSQTVSLPVIGIKNNDSALLAIAEEGGALASVHASPGGVNTAWNSAWFTFRYREYDNIALNEMTWSERILPFTGEINNGCEAFSVLYCFLNGDKAGTAGMAAANRSYLTQKYNLTVAPKKGSAAYLDLPMSVRKTEAVVGMPVTTTRTLTDFAQAQGIIDDLRGETGLKVTLSHWRSGENRQRLSASIAPERATGGISGLKKLLQNSGGNVTVFPSADFTTAEKSGGQFIPLLQGARNISGSVARQEEYLPSTMLKNPAGTTSYLVNPSFSVSLLARFANNLHKLDNANGIAVNGYGSLVYSDAYASVLDGISARRPASSQGTQSAWMSALAQASDLFENVMIDGANSYALPFATDVLNVPLTSSGYRVFTREVPYLQMVLSGMVHSAGTPVNFDPDPELTLLTCLRLGTYPQYCLTACDSTELKGTALDHLISTEYALWSGRIREWNEKYRAVYNAISGLEVLFYEENGSISTTVFTGGITLTINYAEKTASLTTN